MGRHLDERLALRVPRLYRRLIKRVEALPPGSPVRRRALERMAARGWAALSRGDDEIVLLFLDSDVEFNIVGADMIDLAEHYHGHGGWLEFIDHWRTGWAGLQITHTPEEVIDLGDRIVTRLTLSARGATSGADVAQTMGIVSWFADGAIVRQDNYWQWSDCVKALRLDDLAPAVSPGLTPDGSPRS
jgi:ketosteroid isomerase-like protein